MKVFECEEQVLRLLDEVGVTDYSNRMYKLIDAAQREIATQWGFIRKRVVIGAEDGEIKALPEDCYAIEKLKGGSYEEDLAEVEGGFVPGIILSGSENGVYTLYYKAYPNEIGEDDANAEIQIPREYHNALCYRVAALTRDREISSEAQAYSIFMEQYNNQISMLERAKNTTKKARVVVRGKFNYH